MNKNVGFPDRTVRILAASGMATGGRVLHHLKTFVTDERNTILFSGFQAGGTRGAAMNSNCVPSLSSLRFPCVGRSRRVHGLGAPALGALCGDVRAPVRTGAAR